MLWVADKCTFRQYHTTSKIRNSVLEAILFSSYENVVQCTLSTTCCPWLAAVLTANQMPGMKIFAVQHGFKHGNHAFYIFTCQSVGWKLDKAVCVNLNIAASGNCRLQCQKPPASQPSDWLRIGSDHKQDRFHSNGRIKYDMLRLDIQFGIYKWRDQLDNATL